MPKRHGFTCDAGELRELAQAVLERARRAGASGCDCDVSEGYGLTVTVRKGKPDTIEHNRDRSHRRHGVLRRASARRRGHASTSDFSRARARADGRRGGGDRAPHRGGRLRRAAGAPSCSRATRPISISSTRGRSPPRRRSSWPSAARPPRSRSSKKIRNSEGATVSAQQTQFVLANSLGFSGGFPGSRHYLSCAVIAEDKGLMQRDDWYSASRVPSRLADPRALGRYAGQRAAARLGARKIATGQAPVLFEAPVALGLHRALRLRGERRQPVPQDLVPARQPRQAGVRAEGAHRRAAARARRAWRARRSTRKAWRRASGASCATAWSRAISSAATRRASSA